MIKISKTILPLLYKLTYIKDGQDIYEKYQFIWVKEDFKYLGYTFYPFIIVRSLQDFSTINHEMIHMRQMKRGLIVGFLIRYGLEYLYNLIKYKDGYKAYRNISYEHEAYNNESNLLYLTK